MRNLTEREQRTVRIAAVGIAVYLVLFFGLQIGKRLEQARADYQKLTAQAQQLIRELQPFENKMLLSEKLKKSFQLDLSKVTRASLVADASTAIQNAAVSGGVQLGPIRESPARPSAKELASMQLEASGPVPAILSLLQQLQTLGYPVVLDSILITSDAAKPGLVKLTLTLVILDFQQWAIPEEASHA